MLYRKLLLLLQVHFVRRRAGLREGHFWGEKLRIFGRGFLLAKSGVLFHLAGQLPLHATYFQIAE